MKSAHDSCDLDLLSHVRRTMYDVRIRSVAQH